MLDCECGAELIQDDCETILNVCQEAPVIKDYEALENKPQINGVTLQGNKTSEDLGITQEIENAVSAEATLRENADTALGGRIDDELTARENTDTTLGQRIDGEITNRMNADNALGTRIDNEILARQGGDNNLQTQIDAITSKSDVVDVVADYAALQAYDTQHLGNNDVIKVLDDETHDDAQTYYRWNKTAGTWSYIGSEAPYYSKGQMDTMLQAKQDKLIAGTNIQIAQDGKTISATDTTYTAGNGLSLNGTEFSADTTVLATKTDLESYYTKTETDTKLAPKLQTEVVSTLPTTGDEGKLYLTPKDYTTGTATGNPITISLDEDEGAIDSFQLDGDTFQQTYTGKNLYNAEAIPYVARRAYSSTGEVLNWSDYTGTDEYQPVEPSTEYTLWNNKTSNTTYLCEYDENKNFIQRLVALKTFTTTATTKYLRWSLSLGTGAGTTPPTQTQLELGSTATSYEPYVGGQPSPSPAYPQPIQTVTGVQTVTVVGKNLFDKTKDTVGSYLDSSGNIQGSGAWEISEYIEVESGEKYTISGVATSGTAPRYCYYDSTKQFVSSLTCGNQTITIPSGVRFIRLSVYNGTVIPYQDDTTTLQLELGSSASTYAPYSSTDYPISLGAIKLCKIGDYQDYIWKDGDDWKVHKDIGKIELSGDETDWHLVASTGTDGYSYAYSNSYDSSLAWDTAYGISNIATWTTRIIGSTTVDKSSFTLRSSWNTDPVRVRFLFPASVADTVTKWRTYLHNNSVIIRYTMATATDTTITDANLIAQLDAVRTASLQASNTITNTATGTNLAGDMEFGYHEYNPTNRYNKWLWLDLNNAYEKLGS